MKDICIKNKITRVSTSPITPGQHVEVVATMLFTLPEYLEFVKQVID